ncbi:MAG: hypothetical protein JXA16_13565 [Bacteroidales bacterium]|nr:hypothetical protein [Bacteroidales bacterium]
MKKRILFAILICSFSLSAISQKVTDVPIDNYKLYVPIGNELTQTKNGLSVEVIPLHPGVLYEYPEYFSWDLDEMPSEWKTNLKSFYIKHYDGKYYEYPLRAGESFINVYRIKITNNTGHIIKMSDARIYLRVEGEDPIKPVTSFGNATLIDVTPEGTSAMKMRDLLPKSVVDQDNETLIYAVTQIWYDWEKTRKKGILSFKYPIGFPSQILFQNKKAFRLINNVDVEILPEDSYTGILLFPRVLQDNEVNIKMYDFSTKTDAAGNVTEKSNFDFKFTLADGTHYFDRNNLKWVIGDPPQKVEFYDKKLKKWFYGIPQK